MCLSPTYRPTTLGDVRWLRLAGHQRRRGKSLTEDALKAEWEAVVTVREQAARRMVSGVRRLFDLQLEQVEKRLGSALDQLGVKDASPFVLAWLLDEVRWGDWMDEEFRPIFRQVLRAGYRTGGIRIAATLPDYHETAESFEVVRQALINLAEMPDTSRHRLGRLIDEGLREGWTRDQIQGAIRSQFADWKQTRAVSAGTAAATGAFEQGQLEAFAEGGVSRHRWLSQRDDRVRPEHDEADGQEVGLDGQFIVGGEWLKYPGDPHASPELVLNCRCATLPVLGEPPAARTWLDERDDRIRAAYRAAQATEPTFEQARLAVGDRFGLSDTQIKRIVYQGRRS